VEVSASAAGGIRQISPTFITGGIEMAQQVNKQGKIKYLMTQAIGGGWGPANDRLDVEGIVRLEGSEESFGFKLRADDNNLSANLAMLSLLRDAYVHNYVVGVVGWFDPGKKNGRLARVDLHTGAGFAAEEAENAVEALRDFAELAR
jgi:hypothetical protein